MAPTGTLDYDEAVDIFAEQAAALVAGGVDLIWIETMSDLLEIKAAIEGVRRVSPGHRADHDDDVRHARPHDDGRLPRAGGRVAERVGRRRRRWQLRQRAGRADHGHRADARRRPGRVLVAKSNAGMPELVDMRAVYRADPETMATAALAMRDAGRVDHRRLLRQHARSISRRSRQCVAD